MSCPWSWITRLTFVFVLLSPPGAPAEPNLVLIGAPQAWARGVTGRGVVVALLDSGVDMSHPELAARWRGGAHSWFDPYHEHPNQPVDFTGHGTQVLGVILGGEVGGAQIGVAPDAQWIAARVFADDGHATPEAIHAALRWALNPDGDPSTADAPDVLNASWSQASAGCNSEFAADLQALREAGILPVFAAGTDQPQSPANLPDAFAVGALADAGTLAWDSPQGPSVCFSAERIFPQMVAPGVDIHTTDRFGLEATLDGTSLAAAHVSGALALLLSARPGLSANEQAAVLENTAADLGEPGPDNVFGYGRLNVAAAVQYLLVTSALTSRTAALLGSMTAFLIAVVWLVQREMRGRR